MTGLFRDISRLPATLALKPAREPLGGFDQRVIQGVLSREFLSRTAELVAAIDSQLASNPDKSLAQTLGRMRYQFCVEFMQVRLELEGRQGGPRVSDAVSVLEHLSSSPLTHAVAGLDGNLFRDSAGRRTEPRRVPGRATQKPILTLIPNIYVTGSEVLWSDIPKASRELLERYYTRSSIPNLLVLTSANSFLSDPDLGNSLTALVQELSFLGAPGERTKMQEELGAAPLSPGPVRLSFRDNCWWSYARHPHFRIPYGALPVTREFLLSMQRDVALGAYAGHTVQVAGRIDPHLLAWASSKGIDDPGPIPDVEIVFVHPLPSGRLYSFVVKAARKYSQKPRVERESLGQEDRAAAQLIESYFDDVGNKTSWGLLANLRSSDFSPEMQALCDEPWRISGLGNFHRMRTEWQQSVSAQLSEAAIYMTPEARAGVWQELQVLDTEEVFREAVAKRLQSLPTDQAFYSPEFVRLSPAEEAQFMREVVPKLFRICAEEQARVRDEQLSDAHLGRVELGYRGPPEGYPLRLDYMLLDMIVSLRRRQTYQLRESKDRKVPLESVNVPPHIGRSYWLPERFFKLQNIAERLEATKALPTVVAEVFDPLSEEGKRTISGRENVQKAAGEIDEENLRRLSRAIVPAVREARDRAKRDSNDASDFSRFWKGNKALRAALRKAKNDIEGIRQERAAELPRLQKELRGKLRRGELSGEMMQIEIEVAKGRYEREIERRSRPLKANRAALLKLYQAFSPSIARDNSIRVLSIVDQHIVKFTYGVNHRAEVILDEEEVKAEAVVRRTHSEEMGGKNLYAGGELVFARWQASFDSFDRWFHFIATRPDEAPWFFMELNNMSGHYQPLATTLPYAKNLIEPQVRRQGIDTSRLTVVDRLAPGLRLKGRAYGWYKF